MGNNSFHHFKSIIVQSNNLKNYSEENIIKLSRQKEWKALCFTISIKVFSIVSKSFLKNSNIADILEILESNDSTIK